MPKVDGSLQTLTVLGNDWMGLDVCQLDPAAVTPAALNLREGFETLTAPRSR